MKKLLFILFISTLLSCNIDGTYYGEGLFDCSKNGYSAFYRINGCSMDEELQIVKISDDEYSRLLGILENSNEQCVLVTINPLDRSDPISGYIDSTGGSIPCVIS